MGHKPEPEPPHPLEMKRRGVRWLVEQAGGGGSPFQREYVVPESSRRKCPVGHKAEFCEKYMLLAFMFKDTILFAQHQDLVGLLPSLIVSQSSVFVSGH